MSKTKNERIDDAWEEYCKKCESFWEEYRKKRKEILAEKEVKE